MPIERVPFFPELSFHEDERFFHERGLSLLPFSMFISVKKPKVWMHVSNDYSTFITGTFLNETLNFQDDASNIFIRKYKIVHAKLCKKGHLMWTNLSIFIAYPCLIFLIFQKLDKRVVLKWQYGQTRLHIISNNLILVQLEAFYWYVLFYQLF